MTALKAVLIDDEKNNLDNLQHLLGAYCPQVEVVATAISAEEGEKVILRQRPDLVFLDIHMPGKSGFDLLRELKDYSFEVIFITAFDQYAIQAIRFSAVDYLLKPLSPVELQQAVERAVTRQKQKKQNEGVENLLQFLSQKKDAHRIALPALKEIHYVPTSDIIRCEASNNYTIFILKGGEKLTISKPIYEYEVLLTTYGFIRPHQSHLVNLNYVKSWIKNEGDYLLLINGDQLPVSRSKKATVLSVLSQG